jgi:hypothetical protein
MAVFDVSFLNSKLRKATGGPSVGILSDQLTILQNELGKDGFLSPGDYDVLIKTAREIQTTGALTPAQRSDYDVRISNFEKAKAIVKLEKADDIERMNRTTKSEAAEDVMMVGNNPAEFLKGRVASVQAKLNDLTEIIERRNATGQDNTEYMNEYQSTLSEYNEKLSALWSMQNFDGKSPVLGYVAYVTTNEKGEITDVDYGRHGAKSGYAETNSMIDGFQVYGKINFKREGRNYFVLGKEMFSAPDMMIPDPATPGSFKPNKLVANVQQRGPLTVGESGYINIPNSEVKVQSYIPNNSWAKGVGGTIYKRRADGGYSRYLNVSQPLPDMPALDAMITLPTSYEQSLMSSADETIDVTAPIRPDQGMDIAAPTTVNPYEQPQGYYGQPAAQPEQGMSIDKTKSARTGATKTAKQPKQNNPATFGSTIQRTIKSGADYVKNLFTK